MQLISINIVCHTDMVISIKFEAYDWCAAHARKKKSIESVVWGIAIILQSF